MTPENDIVKHLHRLIDHTLLKPTATEADIRRLCQEAEQYQFYAVCVHPVYVPLARQTLSETDVKVCTVVGFPLGLHPVDVKQLEATGAVADGADELDYVINMAHVKNGEWDLIEDEMIAMRLVKEEASRPLVVKAILETGYLTGEELVRLCKMAADCGLDFVKTSTGFGPGGATAEHVALMRHIVGEKCGVKASGGIRTKDDAVRMVQAGANRIGTSSGIHILRQVEIQNDPISG